MKILYEIEKNELELSKKIHVGGDRYICIIKDNDKYEMYIIISDKWHLICRGKRLNTINKYARSYHMEFYEKEVV